MILSTVYVISLLTQFFTSIEHNHTQWDLFSRLAWFFASKIRYIYAFTRKTLHTIIFFSSNYLYHVQSKIGRICCFLILISSKVWFFHLHFQRQFSRSFRFTRFLTKKNHSRISLVHHPCFSFAFPLLLCISWCIRYTSFYFYFLKQK